ncbi:MAG: hypothetical protein KIS76_16820 [Pyrinomonadaceae bacterium]|nr:hypothetical protein [Pyrinomonadaceae bacterium]
MSDKVPEVSPDNIVFTDESICGFDPKIYESPILNRNTEVKIITVDKDSEKAKIILESKQKQYEIHLSNSPEKDFEKSFSLVFSNKAIKIKHKKVASFKKAIEQFGFPIAKCNSENKGWFYILEFSPSACGSFDGCVINVTKKGVFIYGYH